MTIVGTSSYLLLGCCALRYIHHTWPIWTRHPLRATLNHLTVRGLSMWYILWKGIKSYPKTCTHYVGKWWFFHCDVSRDSHLTIMCPPHWWYQHGIPTLVPTLFHGIPTYTQLFNFGYNFFFFYLLLLWWRTEQESTFWSLIFDGQWWN